MSNMAPAGRMSSEGRCDQIIAVAALRFAEQGYASASMSGIARRAGVTRALVYHYFPGKDALLEAVLRRESDRLLAATAPDPTRTPRVNIERALCAYFDHFSSAAGRLRELYVPQASTPSVVGELSRSNHDVQVGRLVEFLGLEDSGRTRLALAAWLAFVEQVASGAVDSRGVSREDLLHICVAALQAVTGVDLGSAASPISTLPNLNT